MEPLNDIDEWQRDFVVSSFNKGVRVATLGSQPAPWLYRGLQILESGQILTAERINRINLSGGTDHPDPTISI